MSSGWRHEGEGFSAQTTLRTEYDETRREKTHESSAEMQSYTVRLLGMIKKFGALDFAIGAIDVQGDLASADVTQKTVRKQRLQDSQLHQVEADAVQRETWKKTADGWKLYRVDNIRDQGIWVDGNLFRRPQ